ncbi:beta strand repeat-containing protein, partial [[Pasteurella] aerogenes]
IVTDPEGNQSKEGKDTKTTDLVQPGDSDGDGDADKDDTNEGAPKVTINDVNGDDTIDPEDLNDDGTVNVTISFPPDSGYSVGDTLTVTLPDGSTKDVPLADADGDGQVDDVVLPFTPLPEGQENVVKAIVTDPEGNQSKEGKDTATTDLIPDPMININSIAGDAEVTEGTDGYAIISVKEAQDGFMVSGTTENVEANQVVTVTITGSGSSVVPVEVTAIVGTDGSWTANVGAGVLTVAKDETFTVVAKVSNVAGTEAIDTDITAPMPLITIEVLDSATASEKGEGGYNDSGNLVYKLTLNTPSTTDTVVTLDIRQTNDDTAKLWDATIPTALDTKEGDYSLSSTITFDDGTTGTAVLNGTTLTITIPAGKTTAEFVVDPFVEDNSTSWTVESNETVNVTITDAGNYFIETATAEGVIVDSNPKAVTQLTRDWSLQVGPYPTDAIGDVGGLPLGERTDSKVLMTDFDDTVYIGYYQNGSNSNNYGNISWSGDVIVNENQKIDGTVTDNEAAQVTVDLAAGDDQLKIRGTQGGNTSVFLGEGTDTYTVGGDISGPDTYVFAEAGDDTITIGGLLGTTTGQANVYMGSGSDTFTASNFIWGTLDLGSGNTMPEKYRALYKDGVTSLGNDDNIDLATDVNTVNFTTVGQLAYAVNIVGGEGQDNITVEERISGSNTTISLGNNDDTVTAGTYITNALIEMGDGNDVVTVGTDTDGARIDLGAGDDVITVKDQAFGGGYIAGGTGSDSITIENLENTTIFTGVRDTSAAITANEDNTIDTVTITSQSGGTIYLGEGDILNTAAMTGGNVYFSSADETVTIGSVLQDQSSIEVFSGGTLHGGAGTDTLSITSANNSISSSNLTGFEVIDLGTGDSTAGNKFSTSTKNVLNAALDGVADRTLYIQGDSQDTVDLGATGNSKYDGMAVQTWQNTQTGVDVNGVTYDVWTLGGTTYGGPVTIYVEQGVTVI